MNPSVKLIVAAILLLAASDASAQTFSLKNGETLVAEVKREADDFFILRGPDGGNRVLLKSKLARLPEKARAPVSEDASSYSAASESTTQLPPADDYGAATSEKPYGRSLNAGPPAPAPAVEPEPPAPAEPPASDYQDTPEPEAAPKPAVEETRKWPAEQEETPYTEPAVVPAPAPAEDESRTPDETPVVSESTAVWKNKAESTPQTPQEAADLIADSYQWMDGTKNYDKAIEMQRITQSPFVLYFYTNWSPECKRFKKQMLNDTGVKKALDPVIKVSLNADVEKRLAQQYNVKDCPAFFLIFPDGHSNRLTTETQPETFLREAEGFGLRIKH